MTDTRFVDLHVSAADPELGMAEGKQHLTAALVLISVAQLMIVLDATIANIALPYTQGDVGISDANLSWIVTGYALAFGSLLLLGGAAMMLVASLVIWAFLNIPHEERATDGAEGVHVG